MKPFVPNEFPTVGVEQEFHLISPQSADLVSCCDEVMRLLHEDLREAACHELFYSVLETQSPVCRTATELEDGVRRGRRAVARACERAGCRPAAAEAPREAAAAAAPLAEAIHAAIDAQMDNK